MAIAYDLEMATPLPAAQVARELTGAAQAVGLLDASVTAEQLLEDGAVTNRGTWIQVFEEKPQPWDPVTADLGFTPTVSVTFRLDKMAEISDQQDDMIQLVSGLLDRVTGDAVLEYQSETIWLLRRGGDLSLNERDDLWPPQRLAAISQLYRRATHTFSEQ